MAKKIKGHYSGIGGQAVLEGVMMKNNEKYAVAVRTPDGDIEVEHENYQGILHGSKIKNIPFLRGIINFADSMNLGMKSLNFSAAFYEDADTKETGLDRLLNKITGGRAEKVFSFLTTLVAIAIALGVFVALPYYVVARFEQYIRSDVLRAILEGALRILIFILYILAISLMKDIRRLYQYHGAEHKCINCLERGKPLTPRNVMRSSRLHKRCGTSFMFYVMFISIILFFFIQVENPIARLGLRILLIPVVAGIAYELIRLAGKYDNVYVWILSAPGMFIQRLTTKEPTRDMVDVAIASVEAVFDWKQFLKDEFGWEEPEDDEKQEDDEFDAPVVKVRKQDSVSEELAAVEELLAEVEAYEKADTETVADMEMDEPVQMEETAEVESVEETGQEEVVAPPKRKRGRPRKVKNEEPVGAYTEENLFVNEE